MFGTTWSNNTEAEWNITDRPEGSTALAIIWPNRDPVTIDIYGSEIPTGPAEAEFDFAPILSNFTDNVVIATYADLDERAGELLAAIEALRSDTTPENLSAARNAWVATRIPWEASEGFLFGPVDFNGYDPALDSWPVNRTDLDGVLASDNDLTTAYVNSLDGTLKGFHTIEYLLFDEGGSKTAADFTEREFAYLIATTQDLKATTEALHTSWISSGGNFGQKVRNAGSGSDAYPSAQSAVQEMVGGMIGICDEVANGKIADPFVEQDTRLVESQFSFNSIADFQNNLRSVLHVYTGDYAGTGAGLDEFIRQADADLDQRLKEEIQTAINEIGRIQYPFRDAIASDRDQIETAQAAVAKVQQTLEEDILPLVLGN